MNEQSERIERIQGKVNSIVRWLFRAIWWRWLHDYRIVRVTGWRSCLYETKYGQRVRGTICLFPWD